VTAQWPSANKTTIVCRLGVELEHALAGGRFLGADHGRDGAQVAIADQYAHAFDNRHFATL
jgi:hypothetical protein